jgi:hypothetical protein
VLAQVRAQVERVAQVVALSPQLLRMQVQVPVVTGLEAALALVSVPVLVQEPVRVVTEREQALARVSKQALEQAQARAVALVPPPLLLQALSLLWAL